MDAITPKTKLLLPTLADAIGEWFPELGGRALAVSEVEITKENVPTLPLVMVAFLRSRGDQPAKSHNDNYEIEDQFVVEFWLQPARYRKANGTDTPFWSYYDYETIRDNLLTNLAYWEAPNGERIAYRGMMVDAESLAVTLTFTFIATFRWCPSKVPQGSRFAVGFNLCVEPGCCPESCYEPDPCDPCP